MTSFINTNGVYAWFPEHGAHLVHPDDLESFTKLVPAGKVFTAVGEADGYITLQYGPARYRVRPDLYRTVGNVTFKIGNAVEVAGTQPPKRGEISGVEWHFKDQAPIYYVSFNGKRSSRRYSAHELTNV